MADKRIPAAAIRRAWLDLKMTGEEAAASIGLTRRTLGNRARALGLPDRFGRSQLLRRIDISAFRTMWNSGVAVSIMAERFDTEHRAIVLAARQLRLDLRGPKEAPTIRRSGAGIVHRYRIDRCELAELWQAPVRPEEIARHFGCSQGLIYERVRAAGLPKRRGPGSGRFMSLDEFKAVRLAARMTAEAETSKAHLRLAEMVDHVHPNRRAA